LTAAGPRKLIEGNGWAFVDWLIPELSGLEMCRRLRFDPRTAGGGARVTGK
jgi:two-component system phosphate regulon response regulator PhoB